MNPDQPTDPWNAQPTPPSQESAPQPPSEPPPQALPVPTAYRTRIAIAWIVIGLCVVLIGILQFVAMQMLEDATAGQSSTMPFDPDATSDLVLILVSLASLAVIATALFGLVLLIFLIVKLANRSISPKLQSASIGHRSAYLEAFAIFLASFIGLQLAGGLITEHTGFQTLPIVLLLVIAPIFWPLLFGVRFTQFRKDMGWTAPRGVLREIGAGVAGYITGLPIVACGMLISALLAQLIEVKSGHPIQQEVIGAGPGMVIMLIGMAIAWAPLVEEAIFRGSLYRHLRGKPGWINWLSASLLSSFIFAAIHPQGIIGIPVLMSIAFVLASMREMRDSIIPCIVAHAINNSLAMALLLVMVYG